MRRLCHTDQNYKTAPPDYQMLLGHLSLFLTYRSIPEGWHDPGGIVTPPCSRLNRMNAQVFRQPTCTSTNPRMLTTHKSPLHCEHSPWTSVTNHDSWSPLDAIKNTRKHRLPPRLEVGIPVPLHHTILRPGICRGDMSLETSSLMIVVHLEWKPAPRMQTTVRPKSKS